MSLLTLVTVLKDGSHLLYQMHPPCGGAGLVIAAHAASRERQYGEDVAKIIILNGDDLTSQEQTQ